jgi:hypothetical protein
MTKESERVDESLKYENLAKAIILIILTMIVSGILAFVLSGGRI